MLHINKTYYISLDSNNIHIIIITLVFGTHTDLYQQTSNEQKQTHLKKKHS